MSNIPQIKPINSQKSKNKSRISKRQRNRRRNKQKQINNNNQNKTQTQIPFCQIAQKNGAEVWQVAYENAVRWHGEHQNNFWRHAAEHLEKENLMLRQQLNRVVNIKPETQTYYETSDEDDEEKVISVKQEDGDEEIDSKYLEFLEVTIKHREELRLKREAESLEDDDLSTKID